MGFDVVPTVPVVPGNRCRSVRGVVRPYAALYVGGMGSRDKNFYNQLMSRMGYEQAAIDVQDRYMNKDYAGAAAAVAVRILGYDISVGTARTNR